MRKRCHGDYRLLSSQKNGRSMVTSQYVRAFRWPKIQPFLWFYDPFVFLVTLDFLSILNSVLKTVQKTLHLTRCIIIMEQNYGTNR
jgi:hypothetical protein